MEIDNRKSFARAIAPARRGTLDLRASLQSRHLDPLEPVRPFGG